MVSAGGVVNVNKTKTAVAVLILISVLVILFYSDVFRIQPKQTYLKWNTFAPSKEISQSWTNNNCLKNKMEFTIKNLAEINDNLKESTSSRCRLLYEKLSTIYIIEKNPAPLVIPETFMGKVKKWLKNDEELFKEIYKQEVTSVYNEWTRENTIFNPLREKRPISKPQEPEKDYVKKLVDQSSQSCDFCNYKQFTAEDVFGRLESKYAFTASNSFKLEKYHELFALKSHHPHNWNLVQYMDMMNLTLKWFEKAHKDDGSFCCPEVIWDILPRAGASQIHPHMHGLIGKNRYHGESEKMRRAATDYKQKTGGDYFADLVDVHAALGLTVHHGDAVALANLTPKKDHEIIVISGHPGKHFYEMIFLVLRAFIDDLEKLAISMGIGLPHLDNSGNLPAFARIVTRGAVAEVRSDISSLELFSATNVNIDPFQVIKAIKASVEKRAVPTR